MNTASGIGDCKAKKLLKVKKKKKSEIEVCKGDQQLREMGLYCSDVHLKLP